MVRRGHTSRAICASSNPATARSSLILTHPPTMGAGGHLGGAYPSWVENTTVFDSNYNRVLRWIEEGRPNN